MIRGLPQIQPQNYRGSDANEGILVITRLIGVPRSRSFELEHDLQNSCKNKNKESRDKNREPRIPKDSAHAEPGYKNPNQIRTANHPLKENCERQERWRERTGSLKDGFSTHESLSPPWLMLGLHLSLFIMELIKLFCSI